MNISKNTQVLRMPFPAGAVMFLLQGNRSEAPMSHSNENCLHALDFAGFEDMIVAAADGEVVHTYTTAIEGNFQDGFGFGNFIKIRHESGFYTFYSHLDEVSVSVNQTVCSGDLIGTLGCTGWTKVPHLHFSLHQGRADLDGVLETREMKEILTFDMEEDRGFSFRSSLELQGAGCYINSNGHYYGSENSSLYHGIECEPDMQLSDVLRCNYQKLKEVVEYRPEVLQPHFVA